MDLLNSRTSNFEISLGHKNATGYAGIGPFEYSIVKRAITYEVLLFLFIRLSRACINAWQTRLSGATGRKQQRAPLHNPSMFRQNDK